MNLRVTYGMNEIFGKQVFYRRIIIKNNKYREELATPTLATISAKELNFRVRDGNGCIRCLAVLDTIFFFRRCKTNSINK